MIVPEKLMGSVQGPAVFVPMTPGLYARLFADYYGWPSRGLRLCGVTGTNGKTTVAHIVASIFQSAGYRYGLMGTTGDLIAGDGRSTTLTTRYPPGLQRSLRELRDRDGSHAVLEASSHGIYEHRIGGLEFDAVGFTSFSQEHLNFHRTMKEYLRVKCQLPARYGKPGGVAVVAMDNNSGAIAFCESARRRGMHVWKVTSDPKTSADVRVRAKRSDGQSELVLLELATPRGVLTTETTLFGDHNVLNVAVAASLTLALDVDLQTVDRGIRHAEFPPGRLQLVEPENLSADHASVFVDYAHTPAALKQVLRTLRSRTNGRLILVFGCGGDRDKGKRPLMGRIASSRADHVILTSDNPRSESPQGICNEIMSGVTDRSNVQVVIDRKSAINLAINVSSQSDIVLLAGKGHEQFQDLCGVREPFSDADVAASILKRRFAAKAERLS